MDAKYRRNRKMSEKINSKVTTTLATPKLQNQKDPCIEADEGGDVKFLPMSRFNFLKKYYPFCCFLLKYSIDLEV